MVRGAAVLAVAVLAASCDPTVIKANCADLAPQELNEAEVCLGPPVTTTGLQSCFLGPKGNEVPVCLVGPDARIYRAFVTPAATIRGAGWTHSAYVGSPSTLTSADTSRCANVLPADAGSLAACP